MDRDGEHNVWSAEMTLVYGSSAQTTGDSVEIKTPSVVSSQVDRENGLSSDFKVESSGGAEGDNPACTGTGGAAGTTAKASHIRHQRGMVETTIGHEHMST